MTRSVWQSYSDDPNRLLLHASAISLVGRGLLIVGPSGCGKSTLALSMMAQGAQLVSDDRVWVDPGDPDPVLGTPDAVAGQIEARGIGVLAAPYQKSAPLVLCVDMSKGCEARLPPQGFTLIYDRRVPVVAGKNQYGLGPALLQLLRSGFAPNG